MRTLIVFLIACGGGGQSPDVGAECDLGASGSEIVIQKPVAQCKTQICLHITTNSPDLCTLECETDDDCVAAPGSPCTAGFTCAPALSIGPFACENLCICADRVPTTACP